MTDWRSATLRKLVIGGLPASVSQNLRSQAARRTIRGKNLIANADRLGREALRIIRSGMIQSET